MKFVRESRQPGANFNVYEPDSGTVEIYVDGTVGSNVSIGVVKMDLHVVSGVDASESDEGPVEKRVVTHRLVMPLMSWLDMCSNSLITIKANEPVLINAFDDSKKRIQDLLSNVK